MKRNVQNRLRWDVVLTGICMYFQKNVEKEEIFHTAQIEK